MGKRRNRRRGGRMAKRTLMHQLKSRSLLLTLEHDEEHQKLKAQHKEYLKGISDMENDILSRTVTVGSVLSLHNHGNLQKLKVFMEHNYGRVERCEIHKKKSRKPARYPMARVRFHNPRDAAKLFGGTPLGEVRRKGRRERILCPSVGYNGVILVQPLKFYVGLVQEDITDESVVKINTEHLSIGYWFPEGKDACFNVQGLADLCKNDPNIWYDDTVTRVNPIVTINLQSSIVELDVSNSPSERSQIFTPASISNVLGDIFESDLDDDDFGGRVVASFRFKDLAQPMDICKGEDDSSYIIFILKQPPRIQRTSLHMLTDWETRTRLTNINGVADDALGNCLGYKLKVTNAEIFRLVYNTQTFSKLQKFGVFQSDFNSLQQAEPFQIQVIPTEKRKDLESKLSKLGISRTGLLVRSMLDHQSCCWFDLLQDSVTIEDDTSKDLFGLVTQGHEETVHYVLTEMKEAREKTRYPAHMFYALYEDAADEGEVQLVSRQVPDFCINLPRILITPSRISVLGFQLEMSNRLIRKFIVGHGVSEEAFARVTIGDENGDKLFSDDLKGPLSGRIKKLLMDGICINGKVYRFLAYSSSQLKELSVWMVCPEFGFSIQTMRESMGDFSMCTTPSKYAARIGQCFSTTVDTLRRQENGRLLTLKVKDDLPDIEVYNDTLGAWVEHSDGAGLIRKDLLESLMSDFPFGPSNPQDVSAIQIRYGGAKGVLMGWDFKDVKDDRCQGYDVCLRPSMVKFKAPYDRLEVVAVAGHVPYYLNRNVILLTSFLGIPDGIFLRMQSEMLGKLNLMLKDSAFAATFLPSLSGPDSGLVSTLCHMLSIGAEPDKDPFLYSCLHATRSHHLMNLRKKARIHVEEGAVLIGGIDETGLLPEGHIFIQVRKSRKQTGRNPEDCEFEPITGPVLVTKHPVMHPGDVRMLVAIDIPKLRGQKNVVLFSQHGDRPEADKMAGSDLDGDQFAVTWDKRLFIERTSHPMDYSPPKNKPVPMAVNDSSLIEHFLDHARQDNLGRIAMLWLDHAVKERNASCEACLQLAELHSIAVDFPKSGIPAIIPKGLIMAATEPRAHWREVKGKEMFHCDSIVGQLYDQVVAEEYAIKHSLTKSCPAVAGRSRDKNGQILHFGKPHRIMMSKEKLYNPRIPEQLGWTTDELGHLLQGFANYQRHEYEGRLISLMNQYKLMSEGEIATGCILKYHKLHKRKRYDISEEIRRQFRILRNEFRAEYFRAVSQLIDGNLSYFEDEEEIDGGNEFGVHADAEYEYANQDDLDWIIQASTKTSVYIANNTIDDEKLSSARYFSRKLAAAYYIATYSPEMHDTDSDSVLYSFPWTVAADVIAFGIHG